MGKIEHLRNFEKQQLGQIKTVYPEAYSFEQMKISTKFGKAEEFFLTVAPNLITGKVNGLSRQQKIYVVCFCRFEIL